jgi:hypothetical protein
MLDDKRESFCRKFYDATKSQRNFSSLNVREADDTSSLPPVRKEEARRSYIFKTFLKDNEVKL